MYGKEIKFSQLMVNLLLNAIEAYENLPKENRRPIVVGINNTKLLVTITVQDWGIGIAKENMNKIG